MGASQSLSDVAHWLNTRTAAAAKGSPKPAKPSDGNVRVTDALVAKRVTLVGVANLSSLSLWSCISRVYDLSVLPQTDGSVLMTRPRPKVARRFADVPDVMQRVLPRPLRIYTTYDQLDRLYKNAAERFHYLACEKAAASPTGEFTLADLGEKASSIWG